MCDQVFKSPEQDHNMFRSQQQKGVVNERIGTYENTALQPIEVVLFGLRLYVPVNNFSVMSGRSHHFLGITSTFFGK